MFRSSLKNMMTTLKPLRRTCLYTSTYAKKVINLIKREDKNNTVEMNVKMAMISLTWLSTTIQYNTVITNDLNPAYLEKGSGYDRIILGKDNIYTDQEKRYEDWVTITNMFDSYVNKALKVIFLDLDETEQNRILSEIDKLKKAHCISYTKGSSNIGLSNVQGGRRTRRKQTRRKNTRHRR